MTQAAHIGLSACTLGLLLSPLGFVAVGVYQDFAPIVAWLTAPLLLLSMGWLLRLLLARTTPVTASVWRTGAEALCWLFILWFLIVFSDIRLMHVAERWGTTALFFLCTSVLALPLVVWRRDTTLTRRWTRLGRPWATASLVLLVAGAAAIAMAPLLQPSPSVG